MAAATLQPAMGTATKQLLFFIFFLHTDESVEQVAFCSYKRSQDTPCSEV